MESIILGCLLLAALYLDDIHMDMITIWRYTFTKEKKRTSYMNIMLGRVKLYVS